MQSVFSSYGSGSVSSGPGYNPYFAPNGTGSWPHGQQAENTFSRPATCYNQLGFNNGAGQPTTTYAGTGRDGHQQPPQQHRPGYNQKNNRKPKKYQNRKDNKTFSPGGCHKQFRQTRNFNQRNNCARNRRNAPNQSIFPARKRYNFKIVVENDYFGFEYRNVVMTDAFVEPVSTTVNKFDAILRQIDNLMLDSGYSTPMDIDSRQRWDVDSNMDLDSAYASDGDVVMGNAPAHRVYY